MECPKCQTVNPEEKRFCRECGAKLTVTCPQCAAEVLPGDKFCGECGHKLPLPSAPVHKELSFDEKIAKIQRYLPKGLTEKILSQRERIEGEHKQVTVMFCDMAGFTALAEKLGPEDAYGIMDEVYELLIHKVHDYEGTVNEMTGDGIMALFGAPIALEDAPQRAIRSALAIHREMAGFSDRMKEMKEGIPPLKMRVGIHTGSVVVGTLGNDLRVEFKAVGDTVNVASRTEGLAEPGATYVTEETFKLVEGLFRFEALGVKEVKGKKEPISLYRVIAPSARRTRFDVSAERGLTPFVGRDRDLELLRDGFERARAGKGQAFSIMSEAGVGKSRLLYEFRKAVSHEDVTFLEGKCLSYSRGIAYHPIIDILKSNFDIQEADEESEIREKVKKGLNFLQAEEASTLPYILELLSVKESGLDDTRVMPETKKAGIMKALNHIVIKGSEIRPLIMAFEDLHWIDKSSEDVLKDLLERIPGARVLLLFTYRPEFVPTWGGRSYHNHVNLNRLSNRESLLIVSHLLGTEDIDGTLEEFILEKTEGVPFFVEEFIRSLMDLKIIERRNKKYHLKKDVQYVTIPSTIQDMLMARVDSLTDGAKEVLQTGSVVEREFSYEIMKQLMALPDQELVSHLSALKESELLYERGIFPQSSYVFKHALTREVVYNSLLFKRRVQIHEAIGKTIEDLYPDRLEEFYEMLAYQSFRGEDWQRAYKYNREAGLKAHAFSAYQEAQEYFEAALRALHNLPRSRDRIEKEIDLSFNLRAALFPQARHEEWGRWMREAQRLSKEIEDNARLSHVLCFLSNLEWIQGKCQKAIELGKTGLDLARRADDFSCQVATIFHLGFYFHTIGDFPKQIEYHRELVKLLTGQAALLRHGMANFPSATTRSGLALGLAEMGNFKEIEMIGQEAVEIAEKVINAFTFVSVYDFLGMAYLRHGKVKLALELLEKSHQTCLRSGVRSLYSYTAGSLGYAYLLFNEPSRALTILEEGAREENFRAAAFWKAHPLTVLADAYRVNRKNELASETAKRALEVASSREERTLEAWAIVVMAKVNADMGRLEETIDWYQRALNQATELSMLPLTAHCRMGLGQAYVKRGLSEEARSELMAAIDLYRSMDMSFWLPQAESALAKIKE